MSPSLLSVLPSSAPKVAPQHATKDATTRPAAVEARDGFAKSLAAARESQRSDTKSANRGSATTPADSTMQRTATQLGGAMRYAATRNTASGTAAGCGDSAIAHEAPPPGFIDRKSVV